MGKLIKSHLARLVTLSAAGCKYEYHVFKVNITSSPKSLPRTDQFLAAIIGFFNPKILFDFATKSIDPAVKPVPYLQVINLITSVLILGWEWPLNLIAGSSLHRSIITRLIIYPVVVVPAALMYQSTNAALYYLVGTAIYFWGCWENEVINY
jgi:hypothetical protein